MNKNLTFFSIGFGFLIFITIIILILNKPKLPEKCYAISSGFELIDNFTNLPNSTFWNYEIVSQDRINLTDDPLNNSEKCIQFILNSGDLIQNKNKVEISLDTGNFNCVDNYYYWKVLIPNTFTDNNITQKIILGQWVAQPDISKGENNETFENYSPLISYRYEIINNNSSLSIYLNDNRIGYQNIEKGIWNNIETYILWSSGNYGLIRSYLNNVTLINCNPYCSYSGKNLINSISPLLKLGISRSNTFLTNDFIYLKDFHKLTQKIE